MKNACARWNEVHNRYWDYVIASVASLGDISPLGQTFLSLWQFFSVHLVLGKNFNNILTNSKRLWPYSKTLNVYLIEIGMSL